MFRRSYRCSAIPSLARWLACAVLLSAATAGAAADRVREQEIAQCLVNEITTWGDGADRPAAGLPLRWAYRHEGAPPWFDATVVLGAIGRAADAWGGCGVPSQLLVLAAAQPLPDGAVLVQWSDANSRGNFGLANLGARTLALGPGAFKLLNTRNPAYPARDTLQMVLSHEMGHFFGLMDHSRRCVDVMSYYTNAQGERCLTRDGHQPAGGTDYRALLPTACDIARCRAANRGMALSRAP
jgi:hypothetical protein